MIGGQIVFRHALRREAALELRADRTAFQCVDGSAAAMAPSIELTTNPLMP
jgi:hypothetical protein